MIVNKSHFASSAAFNALTRMSSQMSKLQTQMTTGDKYATLAEMGTARFEALSLNDRIGRVASYKSNIDIVNTRLSFLDKAISRLDTIQSDARQAVTVGAYGTNNINLQTAPTQAQARLDEVLTLLNTQADGRYVMGGNVTEAPPVQTTAAILDGSNGRAGFRTLVTERRAADLGTTGQGRLVTSMPALDTVRLVEDGVHPFGFKISTLSGDAGPITFTFPTGADPESLQVQFTGVPSSGHHINLGMTMPDGTSETIVMTAVSGPTTKPGEYQVGVDAATTAANFEAALKTTLEYEGKTRLSAASAYATADNFFFGAGGSVQRVPAPADSATTLVPATDVDTIKWYTGQNDLNPARQSVAARIDDSTVVSYGVRANESGLVGLARALAVMTVETYPTGTPAEQAASRGKFDAVASRQAARLAEANSTSPGSITVIAVELGVAKATVGNVEERHINYGSQLETMLADLEHAPMEEVAMELLTLKTRLEASYTTTASIAQLSLVNYLK